MKSKAQSPRICYSLLLAFAVLATTTFAANKNPTSKLYVADMEGQSEIDTGERIEDIQAKSVHNAQGTVIQTQSDSNNSMVFSNGTGIYLDHDTRMEVRQFVQEPFTPNRTDIETEPSISQTQAYIPRGSVGICAPKMVAGSSMVYATPHASVSIRGKRVVVQASDYETTITSVEGEVTIKGEAAGGGGTTLAGGQQAVIRKRAGSPATIEVRDIPEDQVADLEDKVTMACNARRTVYFDIAKKKSEMGRGPNSNLPEDGAKTPDDDEPNKEDAEGPTKEEGFFEEDSSESPSNGDDSFGFGDLFLDDETDGAGAGSDLEFVPVPVNPVRPPAEVVASPASIVTRS